MELLTAMKAKRDQLALEAKNSEEALDAFIGMDNAIDLLEMYYQHCRTEDAADLLQTQEDART